MRKRRGLAATFEHLSQRVTHVTGSTAGFVFALTVVIVWLVTGPLFHFSDTWQLVINTGTTIITFLMVFIIQRSQNKESLAVQVKLNEIVTALPDASNRLVDAEDLDEEELDALHRHYQHLANVAAEHKSMRALRKHPRSKKTDDAH